MTVLRCERGGLERWSAPIRAENATHRWSRREGLVLTLLGGGFEGKGEASPLPGYSPDRLEDAARALAGLPTTLELDLGDPVASARELARWAVPLALPSARFAVEGALLDLAGQALDRPVHRLLGASTSVRVAALVDQLEGAPARAEEARARGVRTVKLKVGRPGCDEAELAALEVLTGLVGLRVRIDANRSLTDRAVRWRSALAELPLELVEEPVLPDRAPETWFGAYRVGLDETLREPAADRLLDALGPRAALVLKPAVLGGIGACLEWAERGARVGAPAVVSHLFDGPVAAAALRNLACALPGPLDHGLGLERGGGAEVRPGDDPGMGRR